MQHWNAGGLSTEHTEVVEERMHELNYHTGIMLAVGLMNEPVAYRKIFVSCKAVLSIHSISVRTLSVNVLCQDVDATILPCTAWYLLSQCRQVCVFITIPKMCFSYCQQAQIGYSGRHPRQPFPDSCRHRDSIAGSFAACNSAETRCTS